MLMVLMATLLCGDVDPSLANRYQAAMAAAPKVALKLWTLQERKRFSEVVSALNQQSLPAGKAARRERVRASRLAAAAWRADPVPPEVQRLGKEAVIAFKDLLEQNAKPFDEIVRNTEDK